METDRRTMLRLLAAAPAAAGFTWTEAEAGQAHTHAQAARTTAKKTGAPYKPKFFTAHEWATVNMLVDIIIPKDERSGSATDAGVPEFMDFMMTDQPGRQTAMRGGLAWLDRECVTRFDKPFFNSFRDLTASGFWTTKMGMQDLQYMGNVFVPEWKGCPDEVLKKLGIKTESA
jgi:gluconate 2-dehydrogenase gamma chain